MGVTNSGGKEIDLSTIPNDALIVVADGGGARVFRNRGEGRALSLHQSELMELSVANGPAGNMPDGASSQQLDEAMFASQLAQAINEGALKQRYAHLVLIADPTTLGRVRQLLHKEAQQRLVLEVNKTLTNAPVEEIERALQSA